MHWRKSERGEYNDSEIVGQKLQLCMVLNGLPDKLRFYCFNPLVRLHGETMSLTFWQTRTGMNLATNSLLDAILSLGPNVQDLRLQCDGAPEHPKLMCAVISAISPLVQDLDQQPNKINNLIKVRDSPHLNSKYN